MAPQRGRIWPLGDYRTYTRTIISEILKDTRCPIDIVKKTVYKNIDRMAGLKIIGSHGHKNKKKRGNF